MRFQNRAEVHYNNYGTIISSGITCKKAHYYTHDSAGRYRIVENAKIF